MAQVGVAGTTSWGTTLAIILARRGMDVCLWARTEDEAAQLRADGENSRFVPGVAFPPDLRITSDTTHAFGHADLAIVAVPSRSLRENVRAIHGALTGTAVVVSATKGLESHSGMRMSQILVEELAPEAHQGICALSGPNLAKEIIRDRPSSTVVASSGSRCASAVPGVQTPIPRATSAAIRVLSIGEAPSVGKMVA